MGANFPNSPTNGQTTTVGNTVYVYNSTTGAWEILSSGGIGTMTTKGDLLSRSSSGLARVGVGTNDYILTADSAATPGMSWGTSPKVVANTAARPGSPYTGQIIFQTDTAQLLEWSGSAWLVLSDAGAWNTYTPVVTQGVNITINASFVARYKQIGKTVHVTIRVNTTSAGSGGNALLISLPVQATSSGAGGIGLVAISGSGTNTYAFNQGMIWSSYTQFGALSSSGNWWGINPATGLANGEAVYAQLTYEAA